MKTDITIYIALYGAILSTIVIIWDVIKYYKDKPKIKVQVDVGPHYSLKRYESEIGVTVINIGKRPVTIVAHGYQFRDKSENGVIEMTEDDLPKELLEGQHCQLFVDTNVSFEHKILYWWVRDASGRKYYSNKHPVWVERKNWLKYLFVWSKR